MRMKRSDPDLDEQLEDERLDGLTDVEASAEQVDERMLSVNLSG